jgi:hypothetical protein
MAETKRTDRMLTMLSIQNFMRIEAALFDFGDKPGVFYITGKNMSGKSTTLRAIETALGGKKIMPESPIREGADEAIIQTKLGDLVARWTCKRDGLGGYKTDVTVTTAEGAKFSGPQQMLSGFLGSLSFDPLAFLGLDPKKQYETLQGFVKGIDFGLMRDLSQDEFTRRTGHNVEAKRLRTAASTIAVPEGTPKQRVSIDRLSKELETAGAKNTERERLISGQNKHWDNARLSTARHVEITKEIERLQAERDRLQQVILAAEANAKAIVVPDEIDTAQLRRDLNAANETNKHVEAFMRRRDFEGMAVEEEKKAQALTDSMAKRAAEVKAAIEAAEMPVPGLSIANGQVTMGGVPFTQASGREQLIASIGLAFSQNPEMRGVLVRQGGLMDTDGLAILEEMAEARGFQVFVEKVDQSGTMGFVMQDGLLVSTPDSRATGIPVPGVPAEDKPPAKRIKRG